MQNPKAGLNRPGLIMAARVRRGNEAFEQRMRLVRFAMKFRVELAGDEKWVLRQFDNLDQLAVGCKSTEDKLCGLEPFAIGIVEFVAMPMTFVDDERPIQSGSFGPHNQLTRL